jgi:hypothetical protein
MSEPIQIRKMSYLIPISEEMLPEFVDPRPGHLEPPVSEDVAAFEAWKAKFQPLYKEGRKHGWFMDGGPDYGFEYTPPEDRWVYDDEESVK